MRWRSPGSARAARALDEPRLRRPGLRRRRRPPRDAWRDGRLLATRKGAQRAPQRLPRRLCVPARGAGRAHADAISDARISTWARSLADVLLARFEDREHGGFFFTSHDHEPLFHRHEARPRQRDAVGQRRRGARADRARASGCGAALSSMPRNGAPSPVRAARSRERRGVRRRCSSRSKTLLVPPPIVIARRASARRAPAWQRALERALSPAPCASSILPAMRELPRRARQGRPLRPKARSRGSARDARCLPPVRRLRRDAERALRRP